MDSFHEEESDMTKSRFNNIFSPTNFSILAIILLLGSLFIAIDASLENQDRRSRAAEKAGITYYVSPTGSDSNPGTQAAPWKTFTKAAATIKAGETAIFADGTYNETLATFNFDGTATYPITVKAQNKHKAIIYFSDNDNVKINLVNRKYITIQDFEITQDKVGTAWSDVIIRHFNGEGITIRGNKIHNAKVNTKSSYGKDILIEGNIMYDGLGYDAFGASNVIVRNNELYQFDSNSQGILIKGGTRNAQVYNNYIHSGGGIIGQTAIYLGGVSCGTPPYPNGCTYDPSGYEAYNAAAWNNIVVASPSGSIQLGLVISGCKNCGFFNNIVIGAQQALDTRQGGGIVHGWTWDSQNLNPTFKNNIITDCTTRAANFAAIQGTLTVDYNLFHNCPTPPSQAHPIIGDPLFVNKLSDWHLQPASPAINAGATIPLFQTFTDASTAALPAFDISKDKDVTTRTDLWDLGIYNVTPPPSNISWIQANAYASASNYTLSKTGGVTGTWDSGAISSQSITSGNGYAEITIKDNISQGRMFGLNHDNITAAHSDIDYAFFFASSGVLQIYENGVNKSPGHKYAVGDVFKVAIESGVVRYYKNGSVIYTSTQKPIYPLFVDVSLRDHTAKIETGKIISIAPSNTTSPTATPTPTKAPLPTPTKIATPTTTKVPPKK